MFEREEKWELLTNELAKQARCEKYATRDHPKVVAAVFNENGDKLFMEWHYDDESNPVCIHAEEATIKKLLIDKDYLRTDKLIFYTTLEPCNQRNQSKIPCAHRVATMGFSEVHIGMMDPDPNIFGRGIMYLIRNSDRKSIYYAPHSIRSIIWKENKDFIAKREEMFSFELFKEQFPIFTGDEEENYLKWAHALFRMFSGEKIVWLFPRFPTFLDKHKFHATWAEGMLNPKKIKSIELLVHKKEWEDDINKVRMETDDMSELLKKEFSRNFDIDIRLFLVECDNTCLCKDFRGALLYNHNIDCLIVPSYNNIVPMFLICTPKYYAQMIRKKQTKPEIKAYWDIIEGKYKEIIKIAQSINFSQKIVNDLS